MTKTHRQSKTPLYRKWAAMKRRCFNPNTRIWKHYGGRGITVCKEWAESFLPFKAWAEANGYCEGSKLELDRIDTDGNYCPENCRFIDRITNAQNKRTNVKVTAFGETKVAAEWFRTFPCPVSKNAFMTRLRNGWDHETALTCPPGQRPVR